MAQTRIYKIYEYSDSSISLIFPLPLLPPEIRNQVCEWSSMFTTRRAGCIDLIPMLAGHRQAREILELLVIGRVTRLWHPRRARRRRKLVRHVLSLNSRVYLGRVGLPLSARMIITGGKYHLTWSEDTRANGSGHRGRQGIWRTTF
jgi:hypothetical protein